MEQSGDVTITAVTGTSSSVFGSSRKIYALKILVTEELASAIVGRGGSKIAELRHRCRAKVAILAHGEFFPHRVLVAQTRYMESLDEVSKTVIGELRELAEASLNFVVVDRAGDMTLQTLVPQAALSRIIGKGGRSIKLLIQKSGAEILITDRACTLPDSDRVVTMAGPAQALEYIIAKMNRHIHRLRKEPWFSAWASTEEIAEAGAYALPQGSGTRLGLREIPEEHQGIRVMMKVARSLPSYVMEDPRGFSLSFVVPCDFLEDLVGYEGAGRREVQRATGTRITFQVIPNDVDNQTLNIAGSLAKVCAAYMLMMRRYLDAEARAAQVVTQLFP